MDDNEYVGQTWYDLFWDLKDELNCGPIGIGRANADRPGRDLQKPPPDDRTFRAGDFIVLITAAEKQEALADFFGTKEGIGPP